MAWRAIFFSMGWWSRTAPFVVRRVGGFHCCRVAVRDSTLHAFRTIQARIVVCGCTGSVSGTGSGVPYDSVMGNCVQLWVAFARGHATVALSTISLSFSSRILTGGNCRRVYADGSTRGDCDAALPTHGPPGPLGRWLTRRLLI